MKVNAMIQEQTVEREVTSVDQRVPFKVFGLQRTGTNLMVALLTRNFQVHSLEMGAEWKHGPVKRPDRIWHDTLARFVLCVRNPYAWLHSCYRYFRRANGSDGTVAPQFKRDPSVTFEEFVLTPSYGFKTPVHRWNEMYHRWLNELPEDRTALVRQDDQLENQLGVLKAVEQKLGIKRTSQDLQTIDRRVDVGAQLHGSFERDQRYYLNREYMAEYGPGLLEQVNRHLDQQLLDRFEYPRERWALADREMRGITLTIRPGTTDAGDVRAVTFDPYGFDRIKQAGQNVQTYVDVGAHIGATASRVNRMWPAAKILCYEPWTENVRMLRVNMRRFEQVTVVAAAMLDGSAPTAQFLPAPEQDGERYPTGGGRIDNSGPISVATVGLEDAINHFGEIDLLKIGCPDAVQIILDRAISSGALNKIRWVCGRFPEGAGVREWLLKRLKGLRAVATVGKPDSDYFVIEPAS
jgi:FkbM family methyltransferase